MIIDKEKGRSDFLKYSYPAIFKPDELYFDHLRKTEMDNIFDPFDFWCVCFPDINKRFVCGEGFDEARKMAEDVLGLTLFNKEEQGEEIPKASTLSNYIKAIKPGEIVYMISCDTDDYRPQQ